jgi:hypothetical protein
MNGRKQSNTNDCHPQIGKNGVTLLLSDLTGRNPSPAKFLLIRVDVTYLRNVLESHAVFFISMSASLNRQ